MFFTSNAIRTMADEMMTMRKEVCILIDQKLEALPSSCVENTIFRVPLSLYEVNPKAYEPQIVSIGPYHHGKPHLKMMEMHKVRYLRKLLDRMNERNAGIFVASIQGVIGKVRNCYAEPLSMSNKELLEMLVLDGCFIVELIHQFLEENKDEYVTRNEIILAEVFRDLILFENQLPFFLLLELFGMMMRELQPTQLFSMMMRGLHPTQLFSMMMREPHPTQFYVDGFIKMIYSSMPGRRVRNVPIENAHDVHHLLDLVQKSWLPSRETIEGDSRASNDGKWKSIRSATELREAGIQFKKREEGGSLFDIKFKNGVLEIPTIDTDDYTESIYRNVIVCEQFGNRVPKYFFIDFILVMDYLINTGKDVELLCRCGIIENGLGDNEVVAAMFNRLGKHVIYSKYSFFYAKLFNDVNKYSGTPWNKRLASLKHNYFNTPWALISFIAAVVLLILTFLQTTFTIFPRK